MRQKKSSQKVPEISMLSVLRRILQEVNVAEDLSASCEVIVKRVSEAVRTECCSIFITDAMNRCYTLVASVGFFARKCRPGARAIWRRDREPHC